MNKWICTSCNGWGHTSTDWRKKKGGRNQKCPTADFVTYIFRGLKKKGEFRESYRALNNAKRILMGMKARTHREETIANVVGNEIVYSAKLPTKYTSTSRDPTAEE